MLALVAIAMLLCSGAAHAGEKSTGLLSAALIDFHAGRYPAAIELLDQALDADPANVEALYYRGVSHNRLGQHEAGAADLRQALARKPGMAAAALELGQALYGLEEYDEARRWLDRAAEVPLFAGRAHFYLGLVDLRTERYESADTNFGRAAQADPSLRASARYYQGVARYRADDLEAAELAFNEVLDIDPSLAVASQSAAFLRRIREGKPRKYGFFGSAGFDYDTNVRLEPDQAGLVNAGDPADGRAVLTLGGWYVPVQTDRFELSLGYGFFQSLHFDLDANNLMGHRASVGVASNVGRVEYGLTGRFDYYLSPLRINAGGTSSGSLASFSTDGRVQPWLSVPSILGETELFYRYRSRDYYNEGIGTTQDGDNNAFGLRQYYPLGQRGFVLAGYRFDSEDKSNDAGAPFQYDGHRVEAGVGWQFPLAIYANAGYAYKHEKYGAASLGRRDDEHDLSFVLRRPIASHINLVGGYYGKFHDSTQNVFEYDRHIGSVALELAY